MKLRSFKTLNFDSFPSEVKKCLSPQTKKISSYYINSNINIIKSNLILFNKKLIQQRHKNQEIIETNSRFKKYMDKYTTYKKYLKEKDKHKIKRKSKSAIDLLIDNYIKRGYKKPNLETNIFHVNPLNDAGKIIKRYFDEYIKNKKKLVDSKEKNFYYLNKLKNCITAQKFKDNKNMLLELNISNPNSTRIKGKNYNMSNLIIKKYFNSENNYDIEKDEYFKELNEYEQNNIRQLIKEYEEIKKYKLFVDKVLKNKKYFNTIDNDSFDLIKKKEITSATSLKNNNNKKIKIKIDYNNIHENLEKFVKSEDNNEFSSINSNLKENSINSNNENNKTENNFKKKFITKQLSFTSNKNNSKYNFTHQKNNYISLNKKIFAFKDSDIRTPKANKKLSFSKGKYNYENLLNEIKRKNIIKKTEIIKGDNFLEKYIEQKFPKLSKEKSLNYLYNNINSDNNYDQEYLNEYKKYFSRNKNMSESDLNEFIKRDYEPKDFYNLVSTVDDKIQKVNIEDKWRKNYTKIGRIEERKNILNEEKKQDNYINHLLQNFILAKYGKFKLYEYK